MSEFLDPADLEKIASGASSPKNFFLDDAALRKFTGFSHRARQIEQLRKMGVPFHINGRGQAVVACSAIEGVHQKPERAPASWSPAALARG